MQSNKLVIIVFLLLALFGCDTDSANSESAGTGQGGSMTRFAIKDNYLYVVGRSSIQVFDITGENFVHLSDVQIGSAMETIFANGDYLYLGATDAMYIYSIQNPRAPQFVFRYQHIVSCDPVVVQGNRAYVTLRTQTECNQGTNALEIIDITNPYDPHLISNYPMQSPHGLGVRNNLLFICEGENGFKVFDIADERDIKQLHHMQNFHAYDVIVKAGHLIITGNDGIFQYSYTDSGVLTLTSTIAVERTEL